MPKSFKGDTTSGFSNLIALYLFLGGSAAGAFVVLAAADLVTYVRRRRTAQLLGTSARVLARGDASRTWMRAAGYGAALVLLVAGVACLVADLGRPEAFYYLFEHPTASLVSLGSYALAAFGVCVAAALAEALFALPPSWRRPLAVFKAIGVVCALAVMLYTGFLLKSVMAVHLWQSVWLPALFLASSLSCGFAVVLACACLCEDSHTFARWSRDLVRADVLFVIAEALTAAAYVLTGMEAFPDRPFDALLFGNAAALFWLGFVGCGVAAPLILESALLLSRRHTTLATTLASRGVLAGLTALVLAGGFCLRASLVNAGVVAA